MSSAASHADARDQLDERPWQLTPVVRPRAEYSVVHGKLGRTTPWSTETAIPS
ncbi:hypothetical protein AB0O75_48780 [Streptomyces sp. NPDC088921]|uniref:hypothetical protein n=1 Tax=unclassified Streptomyces TaxID=2593676 RepID=UPI003438C53F